MKQLTTKNKIGLLRLWILKVVLFFSVFAFTGYNTYVQSTLPLSVETELVESQGSTTLFSPNDIVSGQQESTISSFYSDDYSYRFWSLRYYNHSIKLQYLTALTEVLTFSIPSVHMPFMVCVFYTDDEDVSFIFA